MLRTNLVILLLPALLVVYERCGAQTFQNPDLEGTIMTTSELPDSWDAVPFDDPVCSAVDLLSMTPDLTSLTMPNAFGGIIGNPYSGQTFMSGLYSETYWQEGIMQTVSGFVPNTWYTVRFHQAVVKQMNALDPSGCWIVYVDGTLAGITSPTWSDEHYASIAFDWETRYVGFMATATTHTLKFLPYDTDPDNLWVYSYYNTSRLGIDSIGILCGQPIDLGGDTTLCGSATLLLDATLSGATYVWQDGSAGPTFTVTQPGTYTVERTINGCTSGGYIKVRYGNDFSAFSLGNDTTLCQEQFIELNAELPGCSYTWHDGSHTPVLYASQPDTCYVTVSDACGWGTDTVVVRYSPVHPADWEWAMVMCAGDSLQFDLTIPGATYTWQDGSHAPTFTATEAGSVWVTITLDQCSGFNQTQIVTDSLEWDLGPDTTLCETGALVVDLSPAEGTIAWQDGSSQEQYTITQNGVYWVTVTNDRCIRTDTVQITSGFAIDLGDDTLLCHGEVLTLDATVAGAVYWWSDGSVTPELLAAGPGDYWVAVSIGHCVETDTLRLLPCLTLVEMPNVLTPDNNGINDLFAPVKLQNVSEMRLLIVNRWGEPVFETTDPSSGWNGTAGDAPCAEGVYFWELTYAAPGTAEYRQHGFLTLLR
jgi:gliding motility-associated-like protein